MTRKIAALLLLGCVFGVGAPVTPAKRVCTNGVCKVVPAGGSDDQPNVPMSRSDKIGIFIGFQVGPGIGIYSDNKVDIPINEVNYSLGVKLGYNYYFMDHMGMRVYGSYDIDLANIFPSNENMYSPVVHKFLFNSDMLYDIYSTKKAVLGVFGGLGMGYAFQTGSRTNKIYNAVVVPINLGISFTTKQRHKIDLYSQIPLFSSSIYRKKSGISDNGGDSRTMSNYDKSRFGSVFLGISYSYVF